MNQVANQFTDACKCQHCNQKIEFESNRAGELVTCPGCGMETQLFIPPTAPEKADRQVRPTSAPRALPTLACPDCGNTISRRAVLCMNCGAMPSLWRVGWYVFCIMGVISIISGLIWAVVTAINDVSKSM